MGSTKGVAAGVDDSDIIANRACADDGCVVVSLSLEEDGPYNDSNAVRRRSSAAERASASAFVERLNDSADAERFGGAADGTLKFIV
jgi:hypothetical protein